MSKKCKRSVNGCKNSLKCVLFTDIMIRPIYLRITISFFILMAFSVMSCEYESTSDVTKIVLRDAGNKLLLSNNDSTSLILPITKIKKNKYQLAFEKELTFEPGMLVSVVKQSFNQANLTPNYIVEVLQCSNQEVAYSYEINNDEEKSIVPCAGRVLPLGCYLIQVRFINKESVTLLNYWPLVIVGVLMFWILFRSQKKKNLQKEELPFSKIGQYRFYPEQNKLVKSAVEISLSKKECELLEIFFENLNDIVKREELEKRVWEDNGVFVGRSLDTYISKLRKKLKEDNAIKLTNIHGVGYKLEVIKDVEY